VKYTFSSFRYHLSLEDPDISSTPTGLRVVFKKFKFLITFNYHVHKVVSENGNVAVFSTDTQGTQLAVDLAVNLLGPKPQVSVSSVDLSYAKGDCQLLVQCTSTFCIIPVSDIANAIAENFNKGFDQAVQSAATKAAQAYAATLSTTVALPDLELDVDLRSSFANVGSNVVMLGSGAVVPRSSPSYKGPWVPKVVPPTAAFSKPGVSSALTNYVVETAMTSAWKAGYFHQLITAADVPADSPIKLSTNDAFWKMAVPGLAKWPNMNISVSTGVPSGLPESLFASKFDAAGIVVNFTIDANFSLVNTTKKHAGFSLQFKIGVLAKLAAKDDAKGRSIQLTPSYASWDIQSKELSSAVGPVVEKDVNTLLLLAVGVAAPKKPVSLPWPADFDLNGASLAYNLGYADLSVAPTYNKNIPHTACGPTERCAATLTCCKYTGNDDECCVFSGATCCSNFCCPQGWQCCGANTCCEPRTGRPFNQTTLAALVQRL
jgi:LBP / BPI / CETP family, C-terminal domain